MDFVSEERKLRKISDNQRVLCREYAIERNKYGQARYDLGLLLIPHQDKREFQKASFEKQLLLLLEQTPENQKVAVYSMYKDYITCREKYKGLALMIQRNSELISWTQSMLHYAREND